MNDEVSIRRARPGDAEAIARVHVASWHEAYRGILPDEQIAARSLEVRVAQWTASLQQTDRVTLVACDASGVIVGFAGVLLLDSSAGAFQSYLQTLYLMPAARGGGIGLKLLSTMARSLMDRGIRNMALRVLRLNPARRFYERLGARLAPEGIANDAGEFDDVVYAFDDLERFVNFVQSEKAQEPETRAEA